MSRKPRELPPEVARAFVKDMMAFQAAGGTGAKADGIAVRQLSALREHWDGKLKLHDVKTMLYEMRDHL